MNWGNVVSVLTFGAVIFIIKKLSNMATKQERQDAALSKIDAATTNIAGDLRALKAEIESETVSIESVEKLERNAAILEALGNETADQPEAPVEGEGSGNGEGNGAGTDGSGIDAGNDSDTGSDTEGTGAGEGTAEGSGTAEGTEGEGTQA